ncbi:MAG: hypothetical protein OXC95_17065 [Dehalococcoidia bacterium]|nr:hypothetical protein [Dehalococcoidia bacterium]
MVQANWKASENWPKRDDVDMERIFTQMKERFDPDGSVFKGTRTCNQFLKQGEIDVVGVELDGSVHAMEVAYHEAGLNYTGGVANRVLKKLLRTMLILDAYHTESTQKHIYFVSPKVHRGVQVPLEDTIRQLRTAYPTIDWQLITNEEFGSQILSPTLEKAAAVADTSELFVRSAKLLELSGLTQKGSNSAPPIHIEETPKTPDILTKSGEGQLGRIQPLVQALMNILLEESPGLLTQRDLRNLMDSGYCKRELDLKLGNHALLRRQEDGREINGHSRYWKDIHGGQYYVCSQWWKSDHCHNAESLLRFIERLIDRRKRRPGVGELEQHRSAFRDYLRKYSQS